MVAMEREGYVYNSCRPYSKLSWLWREKDMCTPIVDHTVNSVYIVHCSLEITYLEVFDKPQKRNLTL